jgi:hypothetical protein
MAAWNVHSSRSFGMTNRSRKLVPIDQGTRDLAGVVQFLEDRLEVALS